jgi:hypothetical protein
MRNCPPKKSISFAEKVAVESLAESGGGSMWISCNHSMNFPIYVVWLTLSAFHDVLLFFLLFRKHLAIFFSWILLSISKFKLFPLFSQIQYIRKRAFIFYVKCRRWWQLYPNFHGEMKAVCFLVSFPLRCYLWF